MNKIIFSIAQFLYNSRRTVAEVTVLLAIPVFLALLHFGIPETTRTELHFYFQDPSLHTIWTSAYLHRSVEHLRGNILTYLLVVSVLYPTWYWWRKRREMWEIILILLFVTPIVTTTFDYLIFHWLLSATGDTVGFSGVASAFAGLLLASIGYYTKTRGSRTAGYNLMYAVFLISAAILILIYSPRLPIVVLGFSLIIIGLSVAVKTTLGSLGIAGPRGIVSGIAQNYRDFALVFFAVTVIFVTVLAMFPGEVGDGDGATNILAHTIGMAWGFIVAIILIRYRTDRNFLPKRLLS